MKQTVSILAFYAFSPLSAADVPALRERLFAFGAERGMRGLTLLATEGINGTVCGEPQVIAEWKDLLLQIFDGLTMNESEASEYTYVRWLVKIREEIVALNMPGSSRLEGTHLSPQEWNAMMDEGDAVVIDARNTYETAVGMFENAIDPCTKHFQEFSSFAASCDVPKDKKVMLYCTGGIRCEKATRAMKDAGYEHVFQLQGGILSYLKEFPDAKFNGECFVFDHRVAVDQQLQPSRIYKLCPCCGDPGTEDTTCVQCTSSYVACTRCLQKEEGRTCSKNCRHHYAREAQKLPIEG